MLPVVEAAGGVIPRRKNLTMNRRTFFSAGVNGGRSRSVGSPERADPIYPGGFDEPGDLAGVYNDKVAAMLRRIRRTQSAKILEAAHAVAERVMRGSACWFVWDMGHSTTFDLGPDRPGVPEIVTVGFDADKARDGDMFFANVWRGSRAPLESKDILVVGSPVPYSQDAADSHLIVEAIAQHRIRPYADIWIETYMHTLGAVVRVKGMPAPVGATSGILGIVVFWMIMADACRILARAGHPVPVRGGALGKPPSPGTINLDAPLMGSYFDTVMKQFEMIGAEAGDIRAAGAMAVDSVLDGRTVYCWSRHNSAISSEGHCRRAGLALMQGIYDREGGQVTQRITFEDHRFRHTTQPFEGRAGDTVFVGAFEPDNPDDLAMIDRFHGLGMNVATFGPLTRNGQIPAGRTVASSAEIHVGRMSDTEGLFALPGFERRVCPASGALLMQTFWASNLAIVDEIIHRTGDVPGVYYSAEIAGGAEYLNRMLMMYEERGY